jgi:hypothetical protein
MEKGMIEGHEGDTRYRNETRSKGTLCHSRPKKRDDVLLEGHRHGHVMVD